MISGPSGVGKGTVVKALAGRVPFHFSVSATTRAPRPGEVDGRDYIFLDEPAFRAWVAGGRLLEWAEYAGHLYGTPREPILEQLAAGHDVILDIEVQGAAQIRAAMPDALLIFLEPPSMDELERRLRRRGDTGNVDERLRTAARELARAKEFDHRVVNDTVEGAVEQVVAILLAHSNRDSP